MFGIALVAAGAAGFIALSYEIVWYRVVSFLTWAPAPAEPVHPTRLLGEDSTEPSVQESVPSFFRRPSNR